MGAEDDGADSVATSALGLFPFYAIDEDSYLKAGVTLNLSPDSEAVAPNYSFWGVFRF